MALPVKVVRMKAEQEHEAPLSDAAVALLKALPHVEGVPYAFPAERGGKLSDMDLSMLVRRINGDGATIRVAATEQMSRIMPFPTALPVWSAVRDGKCPRQISSYSELFRAAAGGAVSLTRTRLYTTRGGL
jgi:hypothetical protein